MFSEADRSWLGPVLLFGVDVVKSGAGDLVVEAIKQLFRARGHPRRHQVACLRVARYRKTTAEEHVEVEWASLQGEEEYALTEALEKFFNRS